MKLRKLAPPGALLLCLLALLLFPQDAAQSARDALALCAQTVIPSLFPFFVLSSLLIACGASALLSALLAPLMRPLFGLSGAGAAALALGLCGGYPVGARTAAELVESGALSREEGERLLIFCNNAGPGFLLGICGGAVFASPRAGAALYLIHVASALFTGILLTRRLPPLSAPFSAGAAPHRTASLSAALPAAVQGALAGILNVCAFVVFFTVCTRLLLRALPESFAFSLPCALLIGFFELTSGVTALPPTRAGFCAAGLGRPERPLPNAQRAERFRPLRPVLSACQGSAGAPLRHFVAACAAVSVPVRAASSPVIASATSETTSATASSKRCIYTALVTAVEL